MKRDTSHTSPIRNGEVVYVRMRVTDGFENLMKFVDRGTKDRPKWSHEICGEVAWCTMIDKQGKPIEGGGTFGIDPRALIMPGNVLSDMKETKKE